MAEIDVQAKKNVDTALSSNWKKSEIKKHNIRAAVKNERKNRPDKTLSIPFIGDIDYKGRTKKSDSLDKEMRKVKKKQKSIDRVWDRIDKHGDKYAGYAVQKDHLKKMGVYRDKKGGQVLEAGGWTQTETAAWKKRQKERQKKQGGGIALRGLGRAFLKGGKV